MRHLVLLDSGLRRNDGKGLRRNDGKGLRRNDGRGLRRNGDKGLAPGGQWGSQLCVALNLHPQRAASTWNAQR